MSPPPGGNRPHFTIRQGFVAATGFGVLALYLLWTAYGAAPLPFMVHTEPRQESAATGAHGGHGAAPGGPDTKEFMRQFERFIAASELPDGSVRPGRRIPIAALGGGVEPLGHAGHGLSPQADRHFGHAPASAASSAAHDHGESAEHAGHAHEHGSAPRQPAAPSAEAAVHEGHGAHPESAAGVGEHEEQVAEVYLMAYQWGYRPSVLRLEANTPYRFRMMAVDTAHGASFQLGKGGHIVRLRPQALVEKEITFTKPGEYLIYCTVYCGVAHDRMQAKVIVTASDSTGDAHGGQHAH